MKMNKKLSYTLETLLIPLLIILFILLIVITILFGSEYHKNKELNQDLIKLSTTNKELKKKNEELNNKNNENINYIYDCSFTKTYNILYLMDGYISEVPEYSYIIVDEFQNHYASTIRIPTNLKKDLKPFLNYEITYYIKGVSNEIIDDMNYINSNISLEENNIFSITIKINKTDKEGVEQINDSICQYTDTIKQ